MFFFFFNDTATTEIYTLSLHDALPICGLRRTPACLLSPRTRREGERAALLGISVRRREHQRRDHAGDRKSTRLNSSHSQISYAVFCLKKKKNNTYTYRNLSPICNKQNT